MSKSPNFSHLEISAPVRVDLAGGTLDIHPLYLFIPGGGLTVNMAVPHTAKAAFTRRKDSRIVLELPDLPEKEVSFPDWKSMDFEGPSGLIQRAVAYFAPKMGLTVRGEISLPVGTGLGASSTLLMATMQGLNEITGAGLSPESIIHTGADLEAQHIKIPTGKQDYFPAMFGGLLALHFSEQGVRREALQVSSDFKNQLKASGVLVFTGASRFSGTNNWNMLKRVIDDKEGTKDKLIEISAIARRMRKAVLAEELSAMGKALEQEWQIRKTLAKGVSNSRIDDLHDAAKKAGAWGGKILGAGGGGCFFCLAPPTKAPGVAKQLESMGATVLPFGFEPKGALKRIKKS